jgi:hypothetical protein
MKKKVAWTLGIETPNGEESGVNSWIGAQNGEE